MQPVHEVLNRIRWDAALAGARFEVAYEDRVARSEVRVEVTSMRFDPDRPRAFTVIDEEGAAHSIPLHRVRTIYRDGEPFWQRPPRRGD